MKTPLARRLESVRPSNVSHILRAATRTYLISFAGGLPAMDLFPVDGIRAASERVLAQGPAALQYGDTVGYRPLREYIAAAMARRGIACTADDVVLTSGSQQGLDLLSSRAARPVSSRRPRTSTASSSMPCRSLSSATARSCSTRYRTSRTRRG